MTEFKVVIEAIGEVKDAEGNLISSDPVRIEQVMTEDELRAAGLVPEEE